MGLGPSVGLVASPRLQGEAARSHGLVQVPDKNQRPPLLRTLSTPEANLQGL